MIDAVEDPFVRGLLRNGNIARGKEMHFFFVVAADLAFADPVGWVEAGVSHSRSVKQPTSVSRFSSNRLLQMGGCESKPVQGEMVGGPPILAAVEVGSWLVTMGIEVPRDNFGFLAYTLHSILTELLVLGSIGCILLSLPKSKGWCHR